MLSSFWIRLTALVLATGALVSAHAAEYTLKTQTGLVIPGTRGAASTTHFGWDNFEDPASYPVPGTPLADDTPDIIDNENGTTPAGVKFESLHGNKNRASTGNYYSGSGFPVGSPTPVVNEKVTVVTDGPGTPETPATEGKTTIIMQMISGAGQGGAPSNFASAWLFSAIDEVAPVEVIQTTNRNDFGQAWVKWELPGNKAAYDFTITSVSNLHMSFDKIVIDTWYDAAGGSHPDRMRPAPPANFTLNKEADHVVPTTRGSLNTTHFGWDTLEDPTPGTTLNDGTPDIASPMTPAGVKFESLHGNLNRASTGNYYSGSRAVEVTEGPNAGPAAVVNEKVTVVTKGTSGGAGKTTIIAQLIGTTFTNSWTFSDINGEAPEIIRGNNGASPARGQIWVKWEIEGNEPSYEFIISSNPNPGTNQAHMSFDKIEIDTWYDAGGDSRPDSMIYSEGAPIAHTMDQVASFVIPSSRGGRSTTYFGWDSFNNGQAPGPIDDSTPDIGSDSSGLARFRTANGETHLFAPGGNLYFLAGTLAEEITVPTDGVPGSAGYTTIMLQIASASSGFGGGSFAGPITVTIDDVAPISYVEASSSTSAQLWAKWIIPGNAPTYKIAISGPPNQAHFSFDKVIVDTKYSRYEGVGDTMKGKTVELVTEILADAVKNVDYSVQLEVEGGATPHTWSLESGALPAGLTLSGSGLLSGVPSEIGAFTFTILVEEDGGAYSDAREFELTVLPSLKILTPETLPTAAIGLPYHLILQAAEGVDPYVWTEVGDNLPAGLTLSPAGLISGTPTAPGDATVTISVTDGESTVAERVFSLPVSGVVIAPTMNPVGIISTTASAEFTHQLTAINHESFQISGLPKGVKLTPNTGEISGRVALAGAYPIQVRALNSVGPSPWVGGVLLVKAIASMQQGTFTALSGRGAVNGELGSLISLKTTATGAFTVSVKTGKSAKSAKGYLNVGAPQVLVEVAGGLLSLDIDAVTGEVTGDHGGAAVEGWRAVWDKNLNPASGREGYYSMAIELATADDALPQGVGFATFTVPANGLLKLAGKTADGQAMVSSGPLGPNGEIAVYAPQHANKGSVLGVCELAEDADGVFSDNEISGALSWQKPATKGRTYAAAFGPVELEVTGRYLAQSSKGQVVLGLPDLGEFDAEFAEGGIGESATVADVEGMEWTEKFAVVMPAAGNAAGLKLKINKSTGAVSGTFTLKETAPPLTRKNVKVAGQIVRTADDETRAVGYFLLPQMPQGSEKASQTPILSGAVYLVQPAP